MNRRNFIGRISAVLAGLLATNLPSKAIPKVVEPGKWLQECQVKEGRKFITYIQGSGFIYCFNRPLSESERMALLREPFVMFKPIKPALNKNHPLSKGLILCELFNHIDL